MSCVSVNEKKIFYFQVERKRHIGNDIVNIIFIDGDSCDFSPNCIKSQFTRILFIQFLADIKSIFCPS